MAITNMKELYVSLLQDTYDSENQITEALPKMAKAATAPQLKKAFENHLEETFDQIKKLEEVFELLDMKPKRQTCEATKGLVKEASELLKQKVEHDVMDAGLIANGQKVEHYEIASYGTLSAYATLLGFKDQAKLLHQILDQEKSTDKKLTTLAESSINLMAKAA
jgi:ferritin-like metal-binding protein YciE